MAAFLARRWFLLAVLAGGCVAVLRPEWLHWTRRADLQVVMACALFLTAVTLESRSLLRALARPGPAVWAAAVSYTAVPLLGWLLGGLLPQEGLRVGLMIAACVPCTLASAVLWTRMAGGDEAAALLSTLLTTGLSWLLTTGWLALATGTTAEIDAARMMGDLALTLVLPVAAGQLLRSIPNLARTATRHKRGAGVVGRLLVLLVILRAVTDAGERLAVTEGFGVGGFLLTAAVCLGTHLLALVGGMWGGRALKFGRGACIAVAFAGSQKTLPVSLYLFEAYYRAFPLAVVPIVCFHVGQLVADTFVADLFLHRAKGRGAEEPEPEI